MSILGFSTVGALFVGLGIYVFVCLPGKQSSPNLLVALGSIFLGLIFFGQAVQWIKLPKEIQQRTPDVCPQCGALIENDAAVCEKCRKQLTE
jgi:hypothetical protein